MPLIAIIALLLFAAPANAATVTIQPRDAVIGEPVFYRIDVPLSDGNITLPVRLGQRHGMEVIDVELAEEDGMKSITFTILPLTLGRITLPEYRYMVDGKEVVVTLAEIDVMPMKDDKPLTKSIPKPYEAKHGGGFYMAASAVALLLMAAAWFAYAKWRRQKPATVVAKTSAKEQAEAELAELRMADYYSKGELKLHFGTAADILRRFIERQYGTPAMERTTSKLAERFPSPMADKQQEIIRLLGLCDMAKFAKAKPTQIDAKMVLSEVAKFVESA